MNDTLANKVKLLDFNLIVEDLSIRDVLHSSNNREEEDANSKIEKEFQNNLQSAAQSSSLLKSKLTQDDIQVMDMYLKVVNFSTFECLVIINNKDFYTREKRKKSYKISEHINDTNDNIALKFSLMSYSEDLVTENITSDGFIFKYFPEKV